MKEEWKELTHYQQCIRLPSVPLQEQWQMTQEEAFDLDQDTIRDKTSTGLRNYINEYYPEHVDAIYSATLKVCNLVYQPDRFIAWIADLNLKTHDEIEQEKQAPPQTDDEDPYIWDIGYHASNKETIFDIRLTRKCNVGNKERAHMIS